jgi:Double zinc ribbon
MTSLSGSTLLVIVVAVVLTAAVIGIFFYLARRLKARRNQILSELSGKPELIQDRAFNRLEMARREAQILARTGADITRAQDQIAQSQAAFDLHQYPRSYELAQSAHETLVNARGRSPTAPAVGTAPMATAPSSSRLAPANRADSARRPTGPAPPAPLPKNRAESHFQIGLLESDLVTARTRAPNAGTTAEADSLRSQAQTAFDQADYSNAFRLALRGRRALGSVETLPPPTRSVAVPGTEVSGDATGLAERVAGSDRCPACGYPMTPEDGFCRGCGIPRAKSTCAACGAPRFPSDSFCGKCGAPFLP